MTEVESGFGSEASSTLVGVASGTPDGGVAVIRISGPEAKAVACSLTPQLPPPRVVGLRYLNLASGREGALVVYMPGPKSFTGEDVVELHVHGGERNVAEVVRTLVDRGCVSAGRGAFTRRAFRNGRLDLDQAEGIAALIAARTRAGVEQARRLVGGEVGSAAREIEGTLARVRLEVEASLDFPEDVGEGDVPGWAARVRELRQRLEGWIGGFERGRRARERVRVVLAGPPNAGKSALFNALLGQDRAIVADVPGTTRDYVEAELELGPYCVTLIDTAGLRVAVDQVERAGVERSRSQVSGADLVLWVVGRDGAAEVPVELARLERATSSGTGNRLDVETKIDLGGSSRPEFLGTSAADGAGVAELRGAIQGWVAGVDPPWIGLARHRDRAGEAREALVECEELLRGVVALELVAFQLTVAIRRLAEIGGRSGLGPEGAEVLDGIFDTFCIGK